MIWENNHESITDLFLIIGSVLVVEGFIRAFYFSASTIIISGIIVFGVGANRALKLLRKNKKVRRKK